MRKNEETSSCKIPTHQLQARCFFEYHSLTQQNSFVEQFITKFDHLGMRCGADEDEEHIIARFLGALHSNVADIVQLRQLWTLDDVCRLALKVEKQLKNKNHTIPTRASAPLRSSGASNTRPGGTLGKMI